jgi:outer membrane lipopolysaccharide assembly protein LptE/RlpB
MYQFGLNQHILDYVDTKDELHSISRQGRHEENWLVIHASYIDLWDARRYHVFLEATSDDWYRYLYVIVSAHYA